MPEDDFLGETGIQAHIEGHCHQGAPLCPFTSQALPLKKNLYFKKYFIGNLSVNYSNDVASVVVVTRHVS
jgi:hypothetical protein